MTPEEKAEKIRQLTWDTIREHGVLEIMDENSSNSCYIEDIVKIITS
jgi:hypothetical protein